VLAMSPTPNVPPATAAACPLPPPPPSPPPPLPRMPFNSIHEGLNSVDDVASTIHQSLGADRRCHDGGDAAGGAAHAGGTRPVRRGGHAGRRGRALQLDPMTKCIKVLQAKAKAKAKSMDQSQARIRVGTVWNGLIRACDWSMLFALLLLRNTLTHFVISNPR
jgi:hypothetical protein